MFPQVAANELPPETFNTPANRQKQRASAAQREEIDAWPMASETQEAGHPSSGACDRSAGAVR